MARKAKLTENFTEASVKARRPAPARYEVWDAEVRGLVLRVSPGPHVIEVGLENGPTSRDRRLGHGACHLGGDRRSRGRLACQ